MTVGLLTQYADAMAPAIAQLRYLITGGDVVDPRLLRKILKAGPPENLLNGYGPTECTTFATTYRVDALDETCRSIPIGSPISNTCAYILDAQLKPMPVGVAGELYLGGPGVAIEYIGDPELTAQRFLPDPFAMEAGARIYKTGDLARWRADGIIEFLGRNDRQIKWRGFRVELEEIEAGLLRFPLVREAAVLIREDVPGERRLVAYVTLREGTDATTTEIRAHLRKALPEYMVPQAIVKLDHMPLTSNGKFDRRALPRPELGDYANLTYEAPVEEAETFLARIWQEVLGVERVGRNDNFFDLGGHSLLAIKLMVSVQRVAGERIGVNDIYTHPTIRELASRLRGQATEDAIVDINQEALLDDSIVAAAPRRDDGEGAVLLTGSTGFVGRFLLAQLLSDTRKKIFCLVRARSERSATERLHETLRRWDLWHDGLHDRIQAIPGDLRLGGLGLDAASYADLCRSVDSIYHCGTSMNHLETYRMANAANVGGVVTLLRFATEARLKSVHYISTLGVFNPATTSGPRVIDELTPIESERHRHSEGYTASKWVGEKLVMMAAERSIPCNIFRLGLVWGDTRLGRHDERQRDYLLFKSCLMSGCAIENYQFLMAPTPVDYVARSIVHLAEGHPSGQGIFHISASRQPSAGLFERCNQIAGLSLELMPAHRWVQRVRKLHERGRSLPVVPLVQSAFSMDEAVFDEHWERAGYSRIQFECSRTHRELETAGIGVPELDDELLKMYIRCMHSRDKELRNAAGSAARSRPP
jgi:myxalamid-type nonribosomal peptide synthetase MxaA